MRTLLALLFSLSGARSFPYWSPRLSPLIDGRVGGIANKLRTVTELTTTATVTSLDGSEDVITNKNKNGKGLGAKAIGLLKKVREIPFALSIATFALGYKLGGRAAGPVSNRAVARRYPLLALVLFAVALRDTWYLIPNWAKKNFPLIGRRYRATAAEEDAEDDPDDLTSFTAISTKLRSLFQRSDEKLSSAEKIESPVFVFLALLRFMDQSKQQLDKERDQVYQSTGRAVQDPKDVMEGMDQAFEYADWAYNELPEGQTLKGNLEAQGYSLLRHEQTALPGQVAHYVAVSPKRKEALIGIKGTSNFEDLLTDCCGNVVTYNFQEGASFVDGGPLEMNCHEGILLSARRLAEDLFVFVNNVLLSSGYKITVLGHSLGAGVAVIFAMILRSRIETLRKDKLGERLQVLAFASPPIVDFEASRHCETFVTTYINNSDIIPRASLSNLVLLLEIMKDVSKRLDEEGLSPRSYKSTLKFFNMLTQEKHDVIMSADEISQAFIDALEKVVIQDPAHMYVGGRVVHMYDLKTKEGYGERSSYEDVGDDFDQSKIVPTSESVYVSDGTAVPLRLIEIDGRMMSDHLSPGYRASIRSLLEK